MELFHPTSKQTDYIIFLLHTEMNVTIVHEVHMDSQKEIDNSSKMENGRIIV